MRKRTIISGLFGVAAAASTLWFWPAPPADPPRVRVVKIEPAEIFDDSGGELLLVTLRLFNRQERRDSDRVVYVTETGKFPEVSIGNRWLELEKTACPFGQGLRPAELLPGFPHEAVVLLPAGSDGLRLWLRYTGRAIRRGRVRWVAERLPRYVRNRLPPKFWTWAGFVVHQPGTDWREMRVELPLWPALTLPLASPAGTGAALEPRIADDADTAKQSGQQAVITPITARSNLKR
jgi:hypothetical protein